MNYVQVNLKFKSRVLEHKSIKKYIMHDDLHDNMNNNVIDVLDNPRHLVGWLEEVAKDNQIVLKDTNDVKKTRTKYIEQTYLGSNPEKCNPLNPFVISYSIVHKFSVFGKFEIAQFCCNIVSCILIW